MRLISQLVQDALLKLPPDRFPSRVLVRALQKLRRYLVRRHNDPALNYCLEGMIIKLPASHELPYILRAHSQYEQNLKRVCNYVAYQYPEMVAIDIGANIGDTAVMMRKSRHFPILCVEGNPHFYQFLKSNLASLPDVELHLGLVGSADQELRGGLVSSEGTARFVEGSQSLVSTISLATLVKEHPRFARPRLIKIDTDGWDCQILTSSLEFLGDKSPVLFFEYDPYLMRSGQEGLDCLSQLQAVGYRQALVYDNLGFYLGGLDLSQRQALEDWDLYFSGRRGISYADLALFHEQDQELYQFARQQERDYVARLRPSVRVQRD